MTKEGLELLLSDRDCALSFILPLILLSTEVDMVMQEEYWKKNTVGALGSSGGKVILILLAKVIIFYVRLTTIDVRWSGLQWLLTSAVKKKSLGFKDRPKDFMQIFFCIFSNRRPNSRGLNSGLVMARLRSWWRSW